MHFSGETDQLVLPDMRAVESFEVLKLSRVTKIVYQFLRELIFTCNYCAFKNMEYSKT
jgi:hypothetical protein